MDANFAIAEQDENLLVLRHTLRSRLLVGLGALAIGSALLWGALTGRLTGPFHEGAWANGTAVFAVALALFGVHSLLNEKTIRVDKARRSIDMQGRVLGIVPRRIEIPFRQITEVHVMKRFDSDGGGPYWELQVKSPGALGGRVLDASSDMDYVNRAAEAMSNLIGCRLSRSEFSVAAARQQSS